MEEYLLHVSRLQIEFSFTKSTGKLWNSYGSRSVVRETKSIERIYREYKIVSNTVLCEGVHLLVVRAEDYMEIVPVGRHVEVKMKVMGKQRRVDKKKTATSK